MFEGIVNFFKKLRKTEAKEAPSKDKAKERLHLVLMQDRANVSADFLELMKQEIIEVIKKYIEVDETAIDVRLTNEIGEDGTNGAPSLYANIPIRNIKNGMKNQEVKEEENKTEIKEENNKEEEKNKNTENESSKEEKQEKQKEIKQEEKQDENKEENVEPKEEVKEEVKVEKEEKVEEEKPIEEEKQDENKEKNIESKEKVATVVEENQDVSKNE